MFALRHFALFALVALALPAGAQDLDFILQREKILQQKLKDDVATALARARTLERDQPEAAVEVLQQALTRTRAADVAENVRTPLVRSLTLRIAEMNQAIQVRRQADQQAAAQLELKRRQEALEKDPFRPSESTTTPYDIAKKAVGGVSAQVAAAERLKMESNLRSNSLFSSIQRSSQPINGIVEYPQFWRELSERRKEKLDPKEKKILDGLNTVLSVDYQGLRFRDVIDDLQRRMGIVIFVNEPALKEANVDYEDQITLRVTRATGRSILRKILNDRGLTYVIQEGTVQIVTHNQARQMTVVRSYPVLDITSGTNSRLIGQMYGPLASQYVQNQNALGLIQMIQNSVDPMYWQQNGGPGSIVYHEQSGSIVVRASAEMHYMLGGVLQRR